MNNVTDLFGTPKTDTDTTDTTPNYLYEITTDTGTETVEGYLVLNSLFVAIARGEGIIYWMQPFESVKKVTNKGAVPLNTAGLN